MLTTTTENKILIGEKVSLRGVEPSDADILHTWENDTSLWPYSNNFLPYSKETMLNFANNPPEINKDSQFRFMISNSEGQTVGCVDLYDYDAFHQRAGTGILIMEKFRGKGYATEALRLFSDYAFGILCLNQLYASIPESNEASLNLFRKSGFEICGKRKAWFRHSRGFSDEILLQKLSE